MSVDWGLAERLAGLAAGDTPLGDPLHPDLQAVADRAAARVAEVTGLEPRAPLPALEVVDRASWARANVTTMRSTLQPALEGKPVPAVGGVVIAAEVGGLVGLMSRAVLGQYELALLEPLTTPRLLLVGPNVREGAEKMEVPLADLAAWVTYHEVCHAVQFAAVPWLREHLGGLLRRLLSGSTMRVDPSALLRLPDLGDLRRLWETLGEGGLVALVAGPERRALLDQVQGAMSLVEGHAEHVMDVAAEGDLEGVDGLRRALDRRRAERPPWMKALFRLIGLDLKMAQYAQGKQFVDEVVARGGHAALNRAWAAPELLPSPAELRDPGAWMRRTEIRGLPAA
jgi:coenzyme F420 biosynthesis associated uncharacterized protein